MPLMVYTWAALSVCALVLILRFVATCYRYKDLWKLSFSVRRCVYTSKNNEINFWHGMQYREIRSLCLKFIGLNIDSQILSVSTQQDLWQLFSSHFNHKIYHNILSMSLLYSATQQTFNRYLFFKMVNDKKNIVILIKNEHNHIFGGYSSIGMPDGDIKYPAVLLRRYRWLIKKAKWYYYGGQPPLISSYLCDPKSFIFCVQSHLHSKPVIFQRRIGGIQRDIGVYYDTCFEFGIQDLMLLNFPLYWKRDKLLPKSILMNANYYRFDASQFGSRTEYQSNETIVSNCKLNMIEVFQIHI
eukprot:486379_1